MEIFPPHQIDFYKSGHIYQYPKGTELVFSNFTPRASRIDGIDRVVFFGLQYFVKEYLLDQWQRNFFDKTFSHLEKKYLNRMDNALGEGVVGTDHLRALHELGYLPIEIRAVKEGSRIPLRMPMLVLWNTKPEFFWLTNYLETVLSATLWGPCTSATIAHKYREILNAYADVTVGNQGFVPYQGHDFSCRGMFGLEASCLSGAGHLLSFIGTDTVPAIDFIEKYYSLSPYHDDPLGMSVPATEHSVMCLGGDGGEFETIKKLITETYPTGIISLVCDTWDFWKVVTEYLPALKDIILARDGKVVIRPDSGDPADIVCGDPTLKGYENLAQYRGAVQCLWETFNGTLTDKGYMQLDEHIGLIYGDSITMERCTDICERLEAKGFASTNAVFGIGSYTYQYNTRDTFGFAIKATYAEVNGQPRNIFKKPKTDDGTKNSAKGLIAIDHEDDGSWTMTEEATWNDVKSCAFELVYKDGALIRNDSIDTIRARLRSQL